MSHTFSVVLPAAVDPLLLGLLDDEHAEATRATDAVAQATAASFLRFTRFLRWTVSGSHRRPRACLSQAGNRFGAPMTWIGLVFGWIARGAASGLDQFAEWHRPIRTVKGFH
jgi:hypothetical protein